MPSPEVLDFKKLLAPILGDNPAGADLRADASPGSAYYAIKDARNAARTTERQALVDTDAPPPDWKPVLQHGLKALGEKSKDLEITAYVIEALARLHGFAGLRDGFRLAREFVEQFWDKLYPLPDEEGLETRVAALAGLNGDDAEGTLINPIARIPITDRTNDGVFGSSHYQEAQALSKVTDAKVKEKKIAAGATTLEKFQQAIAQSSGKFFTTLVEDLTQAQDEFSKLGAALEGRCGGKAPPTSTIRGALAASLDTVKEVARSKLEVAAAPKDGAAKAAAPTGDGAAAAAASGIPIDVIRDREDAFRVLLKVADFFRRTEPHAVLSYTLEQIVRWGRMPLPELLHELIPDEGPRKTLFKVAGIKPPEPPKK
jgi:type VI secretion system protein ImpA